MGFNQQTWWLPLKAQRAEEERFEKEFDKTLPQSD
jgi:hypothetical protein